MRAMDANLLLNDDWIHRQEPDKCCRDCGHPKQYHNLGRGACWNQKKGAKCSARCQKFRPSKGQEE